MYLYEIYDNKKTVISFEVFPPKKEYEIGSLYTTISELKSFNPDFVSVTYGAGGGTRNKTVEIASKVKNEIKIETMAHFTCVNSSKEFILNMLKDLKKNNIKNILALRGDPPAEADNKILSGDFKYAYQLVEFIKKHNDMSIAVAGYPEGHPDAQSIDHDIENLAVKTKSGADLIITQLFFDNESFYKFLDKAEKKGIYKPIIPGIFPILNFNAIKKILQLSNAKIPDHLMKKLEKNQNNSSEIEKIGIEHAVRQSEDLLKNGVKGLHFYTMNKSSQTAIILNSLKNSINL